LSEKVERRFVCLDCNMVMLGASGTAASPISEASLEPTQGETNAIEVSGMAVSRAIKTAPTAKRVNPSFSPSLSTALMKKEA